LTAAVFDRTEAIKLSIAPEDQNNKRSSGIMLARGRDWPGGSGDCSGYRLVLFQQPSSREPLVFLKALKVRARVFGKWGLDPCQSGNNLDSMTTKGKQFSAPAGASKTDCSSDGH